jgi:hypothetical protein
VAGANLSLLLHIFFKLNNIFTIASNPLGSASGNKHVQRGDSWFIVSDLARSTAYNASAPTIPH